MNTASTYQLAPQRRLRPPQRVQLAAAVLCTLLGAGFGVSRATAYRYIAEGLKVLAAQAPDLHTALQRVAAEG